MQLKNRRFLRDVLFITFQCFGGPQAHIAYFSRYLVQEKKYLTEQEFLEFLSLANILPGPASTQTLVAIGHRVGGLSIAILTLLIWMLPSALLMGLAAAGIHYLEVIPGFSNMLKYLLPVAISLVAHSAYTLGKSVIRLKGQYLFVVVSAVLTVIFPNAYLFPIVLFGTILLSQWIFAAPIPQNKVKVPVNWRRVILFVGILLFFALLGAFINRTSYFSLPIRLFENFYRNGILIFGGGQVLVPLMFNEFVEMKHYLSANEFLAGYSLQQVLPGPTFSFSAFIGGMAMKNIMGQWVLLGSMVAVLAINLPGFICMLSILSVWQRIKTSAFIHRALLGISAAAVGFVIASTVLMLQKANITLPGCGLMALCVVLLFTQKIQPIWLILLAFGMSLVA